MCVFRHLNILCLFCVLYLKGEKPYAIDKAILNAPFHAQFEEKCRKSAAKSVRIIWLIYLPTIALT